VKDVEKLMRLQELNYVFGSGAFHEEQALRIISSGRDEDEEFVLPPSEASF
jgi:hypothetical protein